jgi:hypothetical protein
MNMGQPGAEGPVQTLMSRAAQGELGKLAPDQAAAVTEAMHQIGHVEGVPLKKIPPGAGDNAFYAAVPRAPDAPVAVYRQLTPDEGRGYLVTAIVSRDVYNGYQRAEREGILDNPVVQAGLATAAVISGAIVRGSSGRGAEGTGPADSGLGHSAPNER